MNPSLFLRASLLNALLVLSASGADRFVDLTSANPTPPYTSWETASTNIQVAIDASAAGDVIWVTNGVYATGGKVMDGDLTNRIALDKALTVQSVNGPFLTTIEGVGATNGPAAVRCAWLTNEAVLMGFTLQGGATRSAGNYYTLCSGGGAWCASSNSIVANCVIQSNTASQYGLGVYQGSVKNCALRGNKGTYSSIGAAVFNSLLNSCTIVSNASGAYGSRLTNCILYFNYSGGNYASSLFAYCCTTPLPSGPGNVSANPQLLGDGLHLANSSPCRAAGTNLTTGTDLDGQPWAEPPSIGCEQWQSQPTIISQPEIRFANSSGFTLTVGATGQEPFTCWWSRNGVPLENDGHYAGAHTTNLLANQVGSLDAGSYQVVVSNAFGMATSRVAQLVIHYVDAAGRGPVAPYLNWETAATNIQDAIDVAQGGEVVLVADGIYAGGGKAMAGDLTNRVALDKALLVQSVNGPLFTTIQGAWDPLTNGPLAVRGAWLTNEAVLRGFTLQGGATRTAGDSITLRSGGGAWCASSNSVVANCLIQSNAASAYGNGVYQGSVKNCALRGNQAGSGAAYNCLLNSCTVVSNLAGGAYESRLTNCILYYNRSGNYSSGFLSYCCTTPLPSGSGNISANPQLLGDGLHLANASPCRGAGTNLVSGIDIDGQSWANPPSMGCVEWQQAPLCVDQPGIQLQPGSTEVIISIVVAGQEPFSYWWMKDGVLLEEDGHYRAANGTNLAVNPVGLPDAGAYQVVVSNAFGMTTSRVAHLTFHYVDAAGTAPVPPYLSWATAATTIQDAIDAAQPGQIIFVTNGLYATGGKLKGGDLTNRVALDKALLVQSVNGPAVTIIQGAWDPATIGPLAVRCAWLTNGAMLSGFTLRGGATRRAPDAQVNGGGAWGVSTNAVLLNCVVATNAAYNTGGGAYQLTLVNCTLAGNIATGAGPGTGPAGEGGGAIACHLRNCVVVGNSANVYGGGTSSCNLRNCALAGNFAYVSGGAAFQGTLVNCTVTRNVSGGHGGMGGVAAFYANLTNCVVAGNLPNPLSASAANYAACTMSYCCSSPVAAGAGNIDVEPQLLGDGVHLAAGSSCRGAGTSAAANGVDIDGQPWANPPSIGCDEWQPEPVMAVQPSAKLVGNALTLKLEAQVAGQDPFWCLWTKDGEAIEESPRHPSAHAPSLLVNDFGPADAGTYQLVATNPFGMATSAVVRVVVHCVDAGSAAPAAPYSDWATAAANIQDAIDAAATGEFVLVTNGVYSTGGKVMAGDLTNRVALTKPLTVASVNGPGVTIIQGTGDPATTNGPLVVRCAWLTNEAILNGFTLRGGATRTTGTLTTLQSGGGVWASSSNSAIVANCIISNNAASWGGGGCYQVRAERCLVQGNRSYYGAGACNSMLLNCCVRGNSASGDGGGTYAGAMFNCTVTSNSARFLGGGAAATVVANSIVYFNSGSPANCYRVTRPISYSCTTPLEAGIGNIDADPQLLDGWHIAATSPCRGTGSAAYASGTDLEGEAWNTPSSMGCDEVWEAAIGGPLSVGVSAVWPAIPEIAERGTLSLAGQINGRASRVGWSFGDGTAVTNASYVNMAHTWTNAGDYTVTFTAFNTDHPAGVSAALPVHVIPLLAPMLSAGSLNGTSFSLSFPGQPGVAYIVEQATNLAAPVLWQAVSTAASTGSLMQVTDPKATNASRFYRVRVQ